MMRTEVRSLAWLLRNDGFDLMGGVDHLVVRVHGAGRWCAVQEKPGSAMFDVYPDRDDPEPGRYKEQCPVSGRYLYRPEVVRMLRHIRDKGAQQ